MIPLLAFPQAPLAKLIHGPAPADPLVRVPDRDPVYVESVDEAVAGIDDGATVLVPWTMVDAAAVAMTGPKFRAVLR